jgi:hypothetical protein
MIAWPNSSCLPALGSTWVGLFAADKKKAKTEGKKCHAKTMWSHAPLPYRRTTEVQVGRTPEKCVLLVGLFAAE